MTRKEIRFAAPAVEVPKELDWLLARALGPPSKRWEERSPFGTEGFASIAGCAGLLGRVRSRTPRDLLQADLGSRLLVELDRLVHHSLAAEVLQDEVCAQLAELAAERGAPRIFLKGMALRLGGFAAAGARYAGDIDLLVPTSHAADLQRDLVELGCREVVLQRKHHQLPMLRHPLGVAIELHLSCLGVRVCGEDSATAEEILRQSRCQPLQGWPMDTFIPDRSLMVSHLLVHGLAQHGYSPESYPLLQILADLQDLGFTGSQGERAIREGYSWIRTDVARGEITALQRVLQRLEAGERVSEVMDGGGESSALVKHLLAGSLSEEYRQSLKFAGLFRSVAENRGLWKGIDRLIGAVFLTRHQIDRIYGQPATGIGYLARRLWRPIDLVGRAWRTLKAQWALRSTR